MAQKKQCIILSRVSTLGQHNDDQTDAVVTYAKSLGFEIVDVIEAKESGVKLKSDERQSLIDLKASYEKHPEITAIFAWSISRLGRREDVLQEIKYWLIEHKINCYLQNDKVILLDEDGTENKNSSLYWTLFGHFASEEAKEIKAKTSRAKRYLTRNGKYSGGRHLYGFDIDKETKSFIINEQEAQVVYSIFSLYADGKPVNEIIDYIYKMYSKKYNRIKIYQMLRNISYSGGTEDKPYPILIPKTVFNKCRKMAETNNTNVRKAKELYLCHNLIKCDCGANFIAVKSNCSYVCSRHQHKRDTTVKCTSTKRTINMNVAETVAWISAKYFLLQFQVKEKETAIANYNKTIEENTQLLNNIENRLNKVESEKNNLATLFLDDLITKAKYGELKAKIASESKEIEADKVMYQQNITDAQNAIKTLTEQESMTRNQIYEQGKKIDNQEFTDSQMYNIIHQFVKEIRVKKVNKYEELYVTSYTGMSRIFRYYSQSKKLQNVLMFNGKLGGVMRVEEEWLHRFPSPIEILQNRKKLNK